MDGKAFYDPLIHKCFCFYLFSSLSALSQLVLKQSESGEVQEKLRSFYPFFFHSINNGYFIFVLLLVLSFYSFVTHSLFFCYINLLYSFSLRCIYLPNNGVFFISYIIIGTFLVSPLELVRIFQFMEYLYWVVQAKTKLEKQQAVRKVGQSKKGMI